MRVLDLFSGYGGWSEAFVLRGHDVVTVDNESSYHPSVVADLIWWDPKEGYDVILASPPCTTFSMMTVGRNWTTDGHPRNEEARKALRLVGRTLEIIEKTRPGFFVIENPRARLRSLGVLDHIERRTVTYCQYGERRMKPTDLWGGFPPSLSLHLPCKNGAPCHERAPRGTRTSQGVYAKAAAKVPFMLSLAVCLAAERDL